MARARFEAWFILKIFCRFETWDWIYSNSTEPFQGQSALFAKKKKDNSDLKIFQKFKAELKMYRLRQQEEKKQLNHTV